MTQSRKTGLLGEIYAARYLREKNYDIAAANFSSSTGEIDIIARCGELYIFVEVKTRSPGTLFAPSEAVDRAKEERIKSTAAAYLNMKKLKTEIRFDIIEIILDGNNHSVNHIENAF